MWCNGDSGEVSSPVQKGGARMAGREPNALHVLDNPELSAPSNEYIRPGVVEEYETEHEDSDSEDDAASAGGGSPAISPLGLSRRDSTQPGFSRLSQEAANKLALKNAANGGTGLRWHARIFPDDFCNPKHVTPSGDLKARRPLPQGLYTAERHFTWGADRPSWPSQACLTELMLSLVKADNGRYMFGGKLNGWPALTNLELVSLTTLPRSRAARLRAMRVSRWYDAEAGEGSVPVSLEEITEFSANVLSKSSVRATFRGQPWSAEGYEEASKGRVFWWNINNPPESEVKPRVVLGSNMAREAIKGENPVAVAAHMFGHRYAKVKESLKDRVTYHAAVLIEWQSSSGRRTCSVVELAWLNGLGGYKGKSNFVPDRDEPRTALYNAMPDCMKAPWITSLAEIRVLDVASADKDEFFEFLQQHSGPKKRFVEPRIAASGPVRLRHRRQADIFAHLVNYIRENPEYTEESKNCQTFATDLYRHLTGDYACEPYHPLCRPLYTCRAHTFLYDEEHSEMKSTV